MNMAFGAPLLVELIIGFALAIILLYKYVTRNRDYWKRKGVVCIENNESLMEKDFHRESAKVLYDKYRAQPYIGISSLNPELMVIDVELIKHIMVKDFSHFVNRGLLPDLPHDFMAKNLVHMEGDEWRRMRSKLSPTFTSGKMKLYFTLIEEVMKQLTDYLNPLAESNSKIEVKELLARFTTDIIATCAFGLEVNSIRDPENKFRQIGRLMVQPSIRDFLVVVVYPKIPYFLKIFPITHTHPEVSKFILKLLTDTVEYRQNNNIVRKDFVDLLINMKNKSLTTDTEDKEGYHSYKEEKIRDNSGDGLTLKEMAAQMGIFFAAGFETASTTTTYLLFELAKNQVIQDKVRQEIDSVIAKYDGQLSYQCLQEMSYLDKCINETLRRYPSLPFLNRKCLKSYKLPESDFVIEEGVRIYIPVYAIHHDPAYYPDPYKFDPERFNEDMVNSRPQYTFLPFGDGPRVCIGKRMGFMQVQLAAIAILRNYVCKLAPGIPAVLPSVKNYPLPIPTIPVELIISKRKL